MNNTFYYLLDDKNNKLYFIIKSFVVGICSSIVVILYRLALLYAEKISFNVYNFVNNNKICIPFLFIFLGIIGFIVGKIIEIEPNCSGSGIPQIKAILGGNISNNPISVILNKFIGGLLSILSGLSLGREGPSIQLGGCTGDYLSKKFKSSPLERKLLISSGASAGLSAAFNAPLSGVLFSLEELYRYFSPIVLISTMISSVVSDYISKEVFGLNPIFNFKESPSLPLKYYWIIILLGIICGISGIIYNKSIKLIQQIYSKINIHNKFKMPILFVLSGIICLICPTIICGGHILLNKLTLSTNILLIIVLVIAKFIFSIISFGSKAPGGIFFPLLILGCGIGSIFGSICIKYLGISPIYYDTFLILAMAGYFTAIVQAPITSVVLITEMTASLQFLLPLTLITIISYLISDYFNNPPIYTTLLENILKNNNKENDVSTSKDTILITNIVHYGSKIEGKAIKELILPDNIIIITILRNNNYITPKGNTIIKAGDEILTLSNISTEAYNRSLLDELTSV